MHDIIIRDFTVDEAGLAADFFHLNWRSNHIFYRDRQLLLWQYYDNPYARVFSEGLTFKAAFDGDTLVGVFGYIPFAFNRYGSRQYGCHLSAWWVHPTYRRGPLGLRLLHELQYRMPGEACLAGMNTSIAEQLYERLGWVVIRNIPRLIFPLDEAQLIRLAAQDDSDASNVVRGRLGSFQSPASPRVGQSVEISELSSLDCLGELGWDTFYWNQFAPSHIGPAREVAYLMWRYQRIPIFRYRALIARRDRTISGLLVFRIEQVKDRTEKVVQLVDLVADLGAAPPLIYTLIELAQQQEAGMIDFFCTHSLYRAALEACGFIAANDPARDDCYWFPYLFQPLDHARLRLNCAWWVRDMDLHSVAGRHDFFLTKGDYEFDRPN